MPLPAKYTKRFSSRLDLAIRADTAHNWVYATLRTLVEKDWVAVEAAGEVHVRDAAAIYAWWERMRTRPDVHALQLAEPHRAIDALVRDASVPAAVTTYHAENVYQGHLFPRRLDAYVRRRDLPRARKFLIEEHDAKIGGVNFRLLTGDDPLLDEAIAIGPEAIATRYAPFPQVVLDLMTEGGSCGEAAEMLLARAYPHAKPRLR